MPLPERVRQVTVIGHLAPAFGWCVGADMCADGHGAAAAGAAGTRTAAATAARSAGHARFKELPPMTSVSSSTLRVARYGSRHAAGDHRAGLGLRTHHGRPGG